VIYIKPEFEYVHTQMRFVRTIMIGMISVNKFSYKIHQDPFTLSLSTSSLLVKGHWINLLS